jgi:phage terminase small subunit
MTKRKLTIQQQKFADLKIKHPDWSDAKCYQGAYPKIKNVETAKAAASRLLTNVNLRAYLDKVQRKAELKSELSVAKVLNRWNDIVDFDVRKLFSDDNTIKNIKDIDDKTASAISGIKIEGIIKEKSKGMEVKSGKVEFKTIDIKGTLTDAAKHFGLFDKDNQQRKFSLKDILDALPEDYAERVRTEMRKLIS